MHVSLILPGVVVPKKLRSAVDVVNKGNQIDYAMEVKPKFNDLEISLIYDPKKTDYRSFIPW